MEDLRAVLVQAAAISIWLAFLLGEPHRFSNSI